MSGKNDIILLQVQCARSSVRPQTGLTPSSYTKAAVWKRWQKARAQMRGLACGLYRQPSSSSLFERATGVLNFCPSDRQMPVVQSLRMGGCGCSLLGWELQPAQRPVGVASRVSIPMQEPLQWKNEFTGQKGKNCIPPGSMKLHVVNRMPLPLSMSSGNCWGNLPSSLPVLSPSWKFLVFQLWASILSQDTVVLSLA